MNGDLLAATMPATPAPGMYAGTPMADYLKLPAVSAGLLKRVVDECPRAAWYESFLNPRRVVEYSKASDAGTVAHSILLEGSTDCVAIFDPANFPNKDGKGTAKGWTNDAIKEARDAARTAGKIPVLKADMVSIENMVDSAWHFIDSLKNTEPAIWQAFQPGGGESEVTCLWDDNGLLCRMRPDRMSLDRKIIIDPKFSARTTEPNDWSRMQMTPMGYWISAAMYRRGCQRMFGTEPEYIFLVVGQNPPHLCSLVGVDPAGFDHGAAQVERGLRVWRDSVERGYWPGYPARVCYPEIKPWELATEMDRQGLTPEGIPYDPEKLWSEAA